MAKAKTEKTYQRPEWVKPSTMSEEELCSDCFKVVGVKSRYQLVCLLGKQKTGATVSTLTSALGLRQPTISHHLSILKSVDAVTVEQDGREHIYRLNRNAHCFDECQIPF
ncbi:hypothetical protein CL628_04430 [bacterium]|nr:hypothetical protein [bacterium]